MTPNDNIRPVPECSALATDWRGGFPVEPAHAGLWRCIADAECSCGHCPYHCACAAEALNETEVSA